MRFLFLALAAGGSLALAASPPAEINFYAAASLRTALERLAPECGKAAGVRIVFNFGASSDLARQIEAAGKADIFFSADEEWMDRISRAGLVDEGSRRSLLSNRLVVVGRRPDPPLFRSPRDLAGGGVGRLSLANPEAVPAGKYAKAWLEKIGLWEAVKGRVVPAVDARAALAVVESGAAEAGVVYRTDAALSRKVDVLYEVPEGEGPVISYAVAAMRDRPERERARKVVDCLAAPEARKTFESLGFIVRSQAP
jgi:molybdate transport system substrate-binding protein